MRAFGIVGGKNSGKTTLVTRLVSLFVARGLIVSTVKHAHHGFDLDQPGKDSHRHRAAGASEVLLCSAHRWALLHESTAEDQPALLELLARMSPVDLVLIEGFKAGPLPKLQVLRPATGAPAPGEPVEQLLAYATDTPQTPPATGQPVFQLDDLETIADFVWAHAAPVRPE